MQRRIGSSSVRALAGALLALAALVPASRANNIRVNRVFARDLDTVAEELTIEIDVSWENSWRADGPEPGDGYYRDAAWIFVKYRAPGEDEWVHAYLSTDDADHTPPAGGVLELGTSDVAGVDRGVGVFLYSDDVRDGSVSYIGARVTWPYGEQGYAFAVGDDISLSVHAIEMVYVPEGAFWLGSGGSLHGEFTDGKWTVGNSIPFMVGSEDPITIGQDPGKLWGRGGASGFDGVGTAGADAIPADYPKGYAAFYCMKYTITQGQYADFLNHLDETQAGNRFPDKYGDTRHTITGTWPNHYADAPDRGCNHLLLPATGAYLAWAGLRPLTELEYEKMCRGPETPVPNEYQWGTTTLLGQQAFHGADGSGTELSMRGGELGGNCTADWILGAVRAGIYAATAAAREAVTRENAGASYWGIMELSGNVQERYITVADAGRGFTGEHGPGMLDAAGAHDVPDWNWTTVEASGDRGSSSLWWAWQYGNAHRASERGRAAGGGMDTRDSGGRGGRTARAVE